MLPFVIQEGKIGLGQQFDVRCSMLGVRVFQEEDEDDHAALDNRPVTADNGLQWGTKRSTKMSMVPVQEIKRRGISAIDADLENGPVHLIKNNRPEYVVMSAKDYQELMSDLAEARLAASKADLGAGRVRRGTATQLMKELMSDE